LGTFVKALGVEKTKEVIDGIRPCFSDIKWRVRMEAVKLIIELSINYNNIEYF